jgi:hypothetical protein
MAMQTTVSVHHLRSISATSCSYYVTQQ